MRASPSNSKIATEPPMATGINTSRSTLLDSDAFALSTLNVAPGSEGGRATCAGAPPIDVCFGIPGDVIRD